MPPARGGGTPSGRRSCPRRERSACGRPGRASRGRRAPPPPPCAATASGSTCWGTAGARGRPPPRSSRSGGTPRVSPRAPLWYTSRAPSRTEKVRSFVRGPRCSENRDHEDQFLVNINIAAASRHECASRCNVVPGMGQREHRQPDTSVLSERHRLTGSTAMTRSPRCTMHSATDPASTSGSGRPRRPTAQKCCTCFENSRIINRRPHRFR